MTRSVTSIESESAGPGASVKDRSGTLDYLAGVKIMLFNRVTSPKMRLRECTCGIVFAVSLTLSTSPLAASYTITDLGTLGGGGSWARGLNAKGEVVGNSEGRAFIYSNGGMRDVDPLFDGNNVAVAINNSGQVAGWSQGATGSIHAFLYSGDTTADLGLGESSAEGVNDSGQIVGWIWESCMVDHAFLRDGGTTTILGPGGCDSRSGAHAVNSNGQVTGYIARDFRSVNGTYRAFLYGDGVYTDLGTLGGVRSEGYAINASGQVVGASDGRAFLYSEGAMIDLGTGADYSGLTDPDYAAYGINSAGQIVGTFSYTATKRTSAEPSFLQPPPYSTRAWLYSDGVMHDLASLLDPADGNWDIISVAGINDAGQIAATGWGPSGLHALLLTPVTTMVVEYQNTADFPGSPGGHFFYTNEPGEQAIVDSGADGHFVRTGRTFKAGGSKRLCRFYGSVAPGPNSHFYTISDQECAWLRSLQQLPAPTDVPQWNYEGLAFAEVPPQIGASGAGCTAGTIPVYRAYNNAFPLAGPRNSWDSTHRFSIYQADIDMMVAQYKWRDEGIAFCSPQ